MISVSNKRVKVCGRKGAVGLEFTHRNGRLRVVGGN
jgi:hypothetical protein